MESQALIKVYSMRPATEELEEFYQFAKQRLQNGGSNQSLDDLFSEWRACNPTADQLEVDVRAVRASLRDMENDETGRPFEDFAAEFRRRNGI
jgi:hypothetical protein